MMTREDQHGREFQSELRRRAYELQRGKGLMMKEDERSRFLSKDLNLKYALKERDKARESWLTRLREENERQTIAETAARHFQKRRMSRRDSNSGGRSRSHSLSTDPVVERCGLLPLSDSELVAMDPSTFHCLASCSSAYTSGTLSVASATPVPTTFLERLAASDMLRKGNHAQKIAVR